MAFDQAAVERFGQIRDSGAVAFGDGRVKVYDLLGRRQRSELGLERGAPRAQRRQALARLAVGERTARDGVDDAIDLALGLRQAALGRAAFTGARAGQPLTLGLIGGEVARDRRRLRQLGLEAFDHAALDRRQRISLAVGAEAAFAPRAAVDPAPGAVDVVDRHETAAAAAAQQPGQQMLRPACLLGALLGALTARRLHARKQRGLDDAQIWHRLHDPLSFRIGARHTFARARILAHGDPVPHQAAVIKRVAEDAGAAAVIAVDRGGAPDAMARRGDAGAIKLFGDSARRQPAIVIGEDAAHDLRLMFDDDALALARAGLVAIGEPAAGQALAHALAHAIAHALGMALEHLRAAEALDGGVELADRAVGVAPDADAGEFHALAETLDVGEVAGKPLDILGPQHVELAGFGIGQHAGEIRPAEHTGTRHGVVAIDARHGPAESGTFGAAERDLIVAGAAVL